MAKREQLHPPRRERRSVEHARVSARRRDLARHHNQDHLHADMPRPHQRDQNRHVDILPTFQEQ